MAKGQAGRTYTRDSRGRFSSGGGGKAAGKASGGKQPAAKTAAKAVAPARAKATAAKPRKPAATAPRGPNPPPPPWSPAMKQAAAKAKAQKDAYKSVAANKVAPSPRVPGTRDARMALPKSLTAKGWNYSQYMNRSDAESDRRYFAKEWTAARKKELAIRDEIASLKSKLKGTDSKINAVKGKAKGVDQSAAKARAAGQTLRKDAKTRLKQADAKLAAVRNDANRRVKQADEKLAAISASLAKRKADFQKRFGMTYEESIARRTTTRKRRR